MDGHLTVSETPTTGSSIRPRIYTGNDPIVRYLEHVHGRISDSYSVNHPFLQWYSENSLSKEQEKLLFSECYYWFRNIPFYIATMSNLTRDPRILREITINVVDEVCGDKTHADLYLEFLGKIGLSREDVRAYIPTDETLTVNSTMEQLYSRPPIERALGAMFYDETMSGIMVSKINDGLKRAGYSSEDRFFWQMHIDVETGHSNSVFNAIYPYLQEESARDAFEDGVLVLDHLVARHWDAVATRLGMEQLLVSSATKKKIH